MKKNVLLVIMLFAFTAFAGIKVMADNTVLLSVDMHGSGLAAGEAVYFSGDFGGVYGTWAEPGTNPANQLTDPNNDSIYTLSMTLPSGTYHFKFFKGTGWNGGEWAGDPNRVVIISGNLNTNYHWAILDKTVIMNVDMHGSGLAAGEPVYFSGNFGGVYGSWNEPGTNANNQLFDPNNDSIYTTSLILAPAVYAFKFFKGTGWNGGEWAGDPNRGINVVNDTTANFLWGILIPAGTGENPLAKTVSVYPTPFNNTLHVNGAAGLSSISITSVSGKQVFNMQNPTAETLTVNTSALTAGLYFLTCYPQNGNPYTVKIMKY